MNAVRRRTHLMIHLNAMLRSLGLALGTALLTGCVGAGVDETLLPTRIDYQCSNNRVLQVQRAADARTAAVLIDNKPVVLQRMGSAAQEKYGNGSYELYLDGERAMLEQDGRVLFGPCMSGPLPTIRRDRY
jgi:membrane-bound inhibitor of C-type lysozyme